MGTSSHLKILFVVVALFVRFCYANDVLDVISLTSVGFDHFDTPHREYICMGTLEVNRLDESELLLGVCTPATKDLSAAIGTLAISELDNDITTGVNLLYGSLNMPEPQGSDHSWDGVGVNARIKRPEQFYQTLNEILFIDDRTCARKINRTSGHVTTVLGECAKNTLEIPDAEPTSCYGMTYFEEKSMWVFSVVNNGLYVYEEGSRPRLILQQDHLSSVISTSSRQLQRDLTHYGGHNNFVWNKIKAGINRYDFTNVSPNGGNLTYGENFVRYISTTSKSPIDTTAFRHNLMDPAMGSSDADLSISPNGKVLAIGDISLDRLFFLNTEYARKNDTGQTEPLQVVCVKSDVIEDSLDKCTFSSISAAGWVNSNTFVTYEQKAGLFRKFTVTPREPTVTTNASRSTPFPPATKEPLISAPVTTNAPTSTPFPPTTKEPLTSAPVMTNAPTSTPFPPATKEPLTSARIEEQVLENSAGCTLPVLTLVIMSQMLYLTNQWLLGAISSTLTLGTTPI